MSVSDKLNQIAKIRRSQATKERVSFGYAMAEAPGDVPPAERHKLRQISVKANKLRFCGSWIHLREFLNTGEGKILNANLCKLAFLCEVCAVRRQAKQFARSMPKVETVMAERPDLIPVMITRTIKSGPNLKRQADHFRTSRTKMLRCVLKAKSAKSNNKRQLEMGKVAAQIRSFEVKRAAGDENHWHFHEHIFGLLSDYIDRDKLAEEWREVTGDSFIVDVRKIHAKEGDETADPVGSALAEVLKYPLKFAGLSAADAWHAHEVLSGSRMTDCLGLFRGIQTGALETDEPLEDETGPYRDFIARWIESREAFTLDTVEEFGQSLTNHHRSRPAGARAQTDGTGISETVPA